MNEQSDNKEHAQEGDSERARMFTLGTAHQYQTRLLFLADLKASVAMGIVALMLLMVILYARLSADGPIDDHFAPVLAAFLFFEGMAFFLAFLVITPKTVFETKVRRIEDAPNSLFFGFFTQFTEDEYVDYMTEQLRSPGNAQRILITDLYQIGCALKSKYTLLKYTYAFAAAGMIVPLGPTIYLVLMR